MNSTDRSTLTTRSTGLVGLLVRLYLRLVAPKASAWLAPAPVLANPGAVAEARRRHVAKLQAVRS